MPCPKLYSLEARFAASLTATALFFVYFLTFGPRLGYAYDTIESIPHIDHNHPIPGIILDAAEFAPQDLILLSSHKYDSDDEEEREPRAEVKRPPRDFALSNNVKKNDNVEIGQIRYWYFPKENQHDAVNSSTSARSNGDDDYNGDRLDDPFADLETDNFDVEKRASTVYVTANTCLQPDLNATRMSHDAGAPQLRMYISQSEDIQNPGPDTVGPDVTVKDFMEGYVRVDLPADQDVYIGIAALNTSRYKGTYNYDLAVSVDEPYHAFVNDTQDLFFVDGDASTALLITNPTSKEIEGEEFERWMKTDTPPYTMFAHSINDSAIVGLRQSFCGLKMNAQIRRSLHNVEAGMTSRGIDRQPKQQFYLSKLNRSSSYYGFLALEPNSSLSARAEGVRGGGGKLWKSMNFTTKADGNCAVVYDLPFCSDVAYAVPSNPSIDIPDLIKIYDNYAASLFKNFTYSLQQIPCNASDESQYSLARNCKNCEVAYKEWLCAITIPRCHDFTSSRPYLRVRNLAQPFLNGTKLADDYEGMQDVLMNSSRNPIIDSEIKPGPYKEILPCQDLCHELVRSCPTALGFKCPTKQWLNMSYGTREGSDITCSYFGAAYYMNGAGGLYAFGFGFLGFVAFWGFAWVLVV